MENEGRKKGRRGNEERDYAQLTYFFPVEIRCRRLMTSDCGI